MVDHLNPRFIALYADGLTVLLDLGRLVPAARRALMFAYRPRFAAFFAMVVNYPLVKFQCTTVALGTASLLYPNCRAHLDNPRRFFSTDPRDVWAY
jgi:hypothetical protein